MAGGSLSVRPWSRAEKTLVPVYVLVVALWILPGILQATSLRGQAWFTAWSTRLPETSVPLLGGLALFFLPSGRGRARILDIGVLARIDWSTLLLFGGGLSLGALMLDSGLARAIGELLFAAMPIQGMTGIVLASTLLGILVSELTSNTASASLIVPIVLALAQAAGVDAVKPAATVTWLTDEPADTQVQFGTTTSYGKTTSLSTTKVTSHTQKLTGTDGWHGLSLPRQIQGCRGQSCDVVRLYLHGV